jgi:DNA polymerase-3 subunit delta
VFYLLHGPDRFTIRETIAGMRARLAEDDAAAMLNDTTLDGRAIGLTTVREAADAMPFLGNRRLVVVEGMLSRCQGRGAEAKALAEALIAYLPEVPATTRLVLADGALEPKNAVIVWAEGWLARQPRAEAAGVVRFYEAPKPARLAAWLARRAEASGGEIAPDAADALAEAITREGTIDLAVADSELEKLLTYAGDRCVTAEDVALLVTRVDIDRIFALLDELSERRGAQAAGILHRFLDEGEPPLRLLAMVGRQFRVLALARALMDEGTPQAELGRHLPIPPFAVSKVTRQARGFGAAELDGALRLLLQADADVKTGRMDPVLALDLFVDHVCRRRLA